MDWFGGPNRYVCSVLDEMRKILGTLTPVTTERYKVMQATLIEEAQTLVNRMESGLSDWSDIRSLQEKMAKLKKEYRALKAKVDNLKEQDDDDPED